MLTQGRFLISYQIFDNIQVNNIGQTHVREILKEIHSSAMITMVCIYKIKVGLHI